ncbi:unnamed protein product [Paramecium octaurelia]|uniref:Uncharacterized protein n=1 Tax=Paramecium octaurelia TaxID=43137 RepID=A0A8S1WSZ6_PAROT|nr:unnamed protein product [Paramecium octaurelia]
MYGPCYTYTPEGSKIASRSHGLMSDTEDADIPACADIWIIISFKVELSQGCKISIIFELLNIKSESAEWEVCSKKFDVYKENPKESYYLYEEIFSIKLKS